MVFTNLSPFPYQMGPISNITPFTYSDAQTFLEKLEAMRVWLNENLVPDTNEALANLIADFQTGITNAENASTDTKAAWDARFTAFMGDVAAQLTALNTTAVKGIQDTASDPLAYLDSVKILTKFPIRENGEVSWMQGFSLNTAADEIYVSNQNGTELRIDVRSISTGVRKSSKLIVTEDGSYSESIDWFYNGADLCFIIWPKAMAFPNYYSIYNYTQGTKSPPIAINGIVRGARMGDKFVTSDVWGTNPVKKFYVYEWASIIAGFPNLLDTISVENRGSVAAKTQGVASLSTRIIYAQGSQAENPTLTIFNIDGRFEDVRSYSRAEFKRALNVLSPGLVTNDAYLYECEGATTVDGKLATAHVVNSNPAVTADGEVIILQHNTPSGERLRPSGALLHAATEWQDVVITDPAWVHSTGGRCQVRMKNGTVKFRGYLTNATYASVGTVFNDVAALPANIPGPPDYQVVAAVGGNTTAKRAGRVLSSGVIGFYADVATGAWYGLQGCSYDAS